MEREKEIIQEGEREFDTVSIIRENDRLGGAQVDRYVEGDGGW